MTISTRFIAGAALCLSLALAGCSGGSGDPDKPAPVMDPAAAEWCEQVEDQVVHRVSDPTELIGSELTAKSATIEGTQVTCVYEASAIKGEGERDVDEHGPAYTGEVVAQVTAAEDRAILMKADTSTTLELETKKVISAEKSAKAVGKLFEGLEPSQHPENTEALKKLAETNKVDLADGHEISLYGTDHAGLFILCTSNSETGEWALYGTYDESEPGIRGSGASDSDCMPQ